MMSQIHLYETLVFEVLAKAMKMYIWIFAIYCFTWETAPILEVLSWQIEIQEEGFHLEIIDGAYQDRGGRPSIGKMILYS